MCEMACQIVQKKQEEKKIEEEQAAKAQKSKIHACCDDDDDYNFAITPNEPVDSLSMGDEHLDTISATKSDEFIKSSVENLILNPCDHSDEDVPEKIFLNPLFKEEIISMKIYPHHFDAESDLIESMLSRDSSIIPSSSKIDSLLDEFAGELTLLKSIPPGIDETDCHPKNEIRLTKRLLYDNSYPRPPKEFVSENSNADIKSFSPSPIAVKDSDSFMEKIYLSFTPDDPMPPGIEEDDDDSERDVLILKELLENYSLSLPVIESFYFDIPLFSRPPAKPHDGNTGILNIKMMGDVFDQKVNIPGLTITRVSNQEKSPDLLSHRGLEVFQPSAKCPMMIHEKNIPISHYGYECSQRVPLVYEPKPCYTQNFSDNDYLHDLPSINPHIDHHCCHECENSLNDFFCHQCACEFCGNSAHIPACYDDDDDYNFAITPNEPVDSLIMEDEHLNIIPVTESDEFIKSSLEDLVPNPSESEGKNGCDLPACFSTFSNILFDAEYEFDSINDQSLSDEDFLEKIFSNPLFEEEINSMRIDQHHFNVESDLIESLLNHDSSIIPSSSKIDSLLDEFAGELTLLKSIPPGIDETNCHPKNEIRLTKRLLYDNSSPHPPEELVSENSNADVESFSPFPIPNEDSDSFMEEINSFFNLDEPMPPGIEEDDDDSRDILILKEFPSNYSLSLSVNESFYFDIPSSSRPPAKPPDGNT
nr:hypothetical protein [Tanacetum cinerariifolium]